MLHVYFFRDASLFKIYGDAFSQPIRTVQVMLFYGYSYENDDL